MANHIINFKFDLDTSIAVEDAIIEGDTEFTEDQIREIEDNLPTKLVIKCVFDDEDISGTWDCIDEDLA